MVANSLLIIGLCAARSLPCSIALKSPEPDKGYRSKGVNIDKIALHCIALRISHVHLDSALFGVRKTSV